MLIGFTNYKVENGFHITEMCHSRWTNYGTPISYFLLVGKAMPPFTCHFSTTSTTRISSQTLILYTHGFKNRLDRPIRSARPLTDQVPVWSDQLDRKAIKPESDCLNRRSDRQTGSSFFFPFLVRLVSPLSPGASSC